MSTTKTLPPATAKQIAFLTKLVQERPMWASVENLHLDTIQKLNKYDASRWIELALKVPAEYEAPKSTKNALKTSLPDVPAGFYAVPSRTGNNDLDFFRVDRPEDGKWAGYTFVKRVIGGHDDQRVRGTEMRLALEAILATGVDQARQTYGVEIGRCAICNRHLTDDESRAFGIGPTCRGGL